jgi:hypothetical protein
MNTFISIFLSGSVKKGNRDTRDPSYFWTDNDILQIRQFVNEGNVRILNPSDISANLPKERFVADLSYVLQSDLLLVDARTYKGIGIGAEMMLATLVGIPVITLAPLGTEYHKVISNNDSTSEWLHPFIVGLSSMICDSLKDGIDYINGEIRNGRMPAIRRNDAIAASLINT